MGVLQKTGNSYRYGACYNLRVDSVLGVQLSGELLYFDAL